MYNKELKIAKQAAREAGLAIKKEFTNWKRGQAKFKDAKQIVTWVDKKAEKILFSYLKKQFPDYGMISEESRPTKQDNTHSWIIDPLDGTTNFTCHHPYFAVSVALKYKNEIVVAVTYDIILDEMSWAVKDKGAYRNGKKISVSKNKSLKKALISYTHGKPLSNTKKAFKFYQHFHLKAQKCRNFACTSLQMAHTASGHNEAFICLGPKLWDVAAGALLIKEAGGLVTDAKGKEWKTNSKSIVAGNPTLQPVVLKELRKIKVA